VTYKDIDQIGGLPLLWKR